MMKGKKEEKEEDEGQERAVFFRLALSKHKITGSDHMGLKQSACSLGGINPFFPPFVLSILYASMP